MMNGVCNLGGVGMMRYCTNPGKSLILFLLLHGYKISSGTSTISLSVAESSSAAYGTLPENVLKDDNSFWHSCGKSVDPIPYISLKMDKEEEVFMVKVVDRLGCHACSGRYTDVEVRVALTPSYDGAVSCGIKSGDGINITVHE